MNILKELNNDQLDGLARLAFDLARAAFILAILPAPSIPDNPEFGLFKILLGLFWGLVCIYAALILLKAKERTK